jgi:phospholipid transport system transporter-binding protein
VSGELTLHTAKQALANSETLFDDANTLNIDLADVSRSDSAGLALLIAWMRSAKKHNQPITFFNIPNQMLAIAEASGLDQVLPKQ